MWGKLTSKLPVCLSCNETGQLRGRERQKFISLKYVHLKFIFLHLKPDFLFAVTLRVYSATVNLRGRKALIITVNHVPSPICLSCNGTGQLRGRKAGIITSITICGDMLTSKLPFCLSCNETGQLRGRERQTLTNIKISPNYICYNFLLVKKTKRIIFIAESVLVLVEFISLDAFNSPTVPFCASLVRPFLDK